MLYGPRSTSTLELSSRVSLSLITVITFKSTSLIRSWITVDTCIHFVNKSPLLSLLPYLNSCTALWTLEENGSWSTSMSRRTDSTGESSFAFCCFVFVLPWSAAPFLFTKVQRPRLTVPRHWPSDIDGSERGVSPTGDATGVQHIFYHLMQSVRD